LVKELKKYKRKKEKEKKLRKKAENSVFELKKIVELQQDKIDQMMEKLELMTQLLQNDKSSFKNQGKQNDQHQKLEISKVNKNKDAKSKSRSVTRNNNINNIRLSMDRVSSLGKLKEIIRDSKKERSGSPVIRRPRNSSKLSQDKKLRRVNTGL
jgi:hypothetical protein